MAMEEIPLADARNRLSEFVADVEKTQARVTITKHGHPAAVLPESPVRYFSGFRGGGLDC